MLRYVLFSFLVALITLSPAHAQQGPTDQLRFAERPNVNLPAGSAKPNLDHYRVVVYQNLTACPQYMDPRQNLVVYEINDQLSKQVVSLNQNSDYAVGTYMHDDMGWWLVPGSCRVLDTADAVRSPYAPVINRLPNPAWFKAVVEVNIPQSQPGYRLVKTDGDTCPDSFKRRTTEDQTLDTKPYTASQTILAGTHSYGVYHVEDSPVWYAHRPMWNYRLVEGTCQTFLVDDFLESFSYSPQLPPEAVAGYVEPAEPSWSISLEALAAYDDEFVGASLVRFEALAYRPLVITAAVGLEFPTLVEGSNQVVPGFELGAGYSHSTPLADGLLFDWNATANTGFGSVLTHCGPATLETNLTYTCGHEEEGFPVLLTAPWFGPAASAKLLSPLKGHNWFLVGFSASLQVYYLQSNDGAHSLTVDTSQGSETIDYRYDNGSAWWFKPTGAFTFGYAW